MIKLANSKYTVLVDIHKILDTEFVKEMNLLQINLTNRILLRVNQILDKVEIFELALNVPKNMRFRRFKYLR